MIWCCWWTWDSTIRLTRTYTKSSVTLESSFFLSWTWILLSCAMVAMVCEPIYISSAREPRGHLFTYVYFPGRLGKHKAFIKCWLVGPASQTVGQRLTKMCHYTCMKRLASTLEMVQSNVGSTLPSFSEVMNALQFRWCILFIKDSADSSQCFHSFHSHTYLYTANFG